MTELDVLSCLLGLTFVLAPLMSNRFFFGGDKRYAVAHVVSLVVVAVGCGSGFAFAAVAWLLFCLGGAGLYVLRTGRGIFTLQGVAAGVPFAFSVISGIWFVAGMNDLALLGYNRAWSFYAALHGSVLGWLFVGCVAHLARRPRASRLYLWGCFCAFALFLFVAFGIDGVPFVKRVGVIGFAVLVPGLIGRHVVETAPFPTTARSTSTTMSFGAGLLSLAGITVTMVLALLNEFWVGFPRVLFAMPTMVLVHGIGNAVIVVPAFFAAVVGDGDAVPKKRSTSDPC